MNAWLITIGEPLPIDGSNVRLMRTGMLAQTLQQEGHKVLWWTATFDHVRKCHRFSGNTLVTFQHDYAIQLLHSIGYHRNISLRRVMDHLQVAFKFLFSFKKFPLPDIIVVSFPPIEINFFACIIGKRYGIPVITEIRDLWPDIFKQAIPEAFRWSGSFCLAPFFFMRRRILRNSTGILGMSPAMLQWSLTKGNRKQGSFDRSFPFGYKEEAPTSEEQEKSSHLWKNAFHLDPSVHFIACFFGYIGFQFDLETIIEASKKLQNQISSFRLVLCGKGERLDYFKRIAEGCDNIIFPGWVGRSDIWQLMRFSQIGLSPYIDDEGYRLSIPNKTAEYFSSKLPVLSSQGGYAKEFFSKYQCGILYRNGDSDMLADIIVRLYRHPEELHKLSSNAYAIFKSQFKAEIIYKKFIEYLLEVSNVSAQNIQ